MKITYIAFVFVLYSATTSTGYYKYKWSQTSNGFSFNLMGDASVFSINFERILINQPAPQRICSKSDC
jgi:hypothetical protein